jgi:hypothetical protein
MADLLVKLYNVKHDQALYDQLLQQGIHVKRALAPDKIKILDFIKASADINWPQESKDSWISECDAAMSNNPPTCIIAVQEKQLIGFACYNATGKGMFGPTGVLIKDQKKGVGKALLLKSLLSMWEEGYGYAIIGWPAKSAIDFYRKTVDAQIIENSSPGIYSRLVDG